MALENGSGNYSLIRGIDIHKNLENDEYSCRLDVPQFKDAATRTTPTTYDKEVQEFVGITLTAQQIDDIMAIVYANLKTIAPYDSMSDV